MIDDFTTPDEGKSAMTQATDGIKAANRGISDAIETGREPGMPLDILTTRVREAPLTALAVAFVLGVMIGRRR